MFHYINPGILKNIFFSQAVSRVAIQKLFFTIRICLERSWLRLILHIAQRNYHVNMIEKLIIISSTIQFYVFYLKPKSFDKFHRLPILVLDLF